MAEAKKGRKFGRNANYCARYKAGGRLEINKAKRLKRHQKRMTKIMARVAFRKAHGGKTPAQVRIIERTEANWRANVARLAAQ